MRLQAEGFKRLVAVDITPAGDLIEVRGNNGEGKSSVLDAIFAALAGKDAAPIKPVRTGEEYALIKLDLGELRVTRYFGEDGATKLKVENAEGAVFTQGQTMLDALVGSISFDPLEFANMDGKAQAAEIRRLVKLDVDLDQLAAEDKADYEKRREVNRDAAALKARIEGIIVPADLPEAAPDKDAIADKLANAAETNSALDRERASRESEAQAIARLSEAAAVQEATANRLRAEADGAQAEARLKQDEANERRDALDKVEETPIAAPVDTAALRSELSEAERVSALIARRDERAKLAAEFATLKAQSEKLTAGMGARTASREKALAEAKMPVEGLSFATIADELIVTLNGEPFSQASSAEQLKASVAIAMAANPRLRVLRIKDGSLLDKKNLAVLKDTAKANDFQIWGEFVGEEGAGIIMEAGKVKGAPDPERVEPPKRRKKGEAADPAESGAESADQPAERRKPQAMREFSTPKPEGSLL
ncbi:MAG: hypothetical protein H0U52_00605 [Chloroflexi bacterium]|nr:hypothetical protein [Chloroflexota bacterium]